MKALPSKDAGVFAWPRDFDFQHAYVLVTDDAPVETSSFGKTMSLRRAQPVQSVRPRQERGRLSSLQGRPINVPASLKWETCRLGSSVAVITAYHYSSCRTTSIRNSQRPTNIVCWKPNHPDIINQAGNIYQYQLVPTGKPLGSDDPNAISPGATVFRSSRAKNHESAAICSRQ